MSRLVLLTAAKLQRGAETVEDRTGALLVDADAGTIVAVGAAAVARMAEAVEIHDFPGAVLFPCLIDTHAHLVQAGDGMPGPELVDIPREQLVKRSVQNAARALRAGVAVIEDQGGRGDATLLARDIARNDPTNYPQLLVAGPAITKHGGHMWYLGGEADDMHAIDALARKLLADGVDIIKLVASGGGTPGTVAYEVQYTSAELRAGVAAAHEFGRKATAHCNCVLAIENAVDAGVDLIHHANFFDDSGARRFDQRVADKLARSGAYVDPTLWVTYSLFDALGPGAAAGSQAAQQLDRARRHWEGKLLDVRGLYEAGVPFVAGSDAGYRLSKFGDTWHEAKTLHEVVMPVREALAAATDRAAKALGLSKTGRLEVGFTADVLVLQGNPVEDMRHLGSPIAIYRLGHRVSAEMPGSSEPGRN